MNGTLYGVGVGPGDPRLMTYLAVDTIKNCPVIAVPADGKEKAVFDGIYCEVSHKSRISRADTYTI